MKKLLFVLSMLLLTSCIAIDDFGTAWDAADKDPSLMGRWIPVIVNNDANEADMFQIVDNGRSYRAHPFKNGKKMKEKKDQPAIKTLQVGDYHFILSRDSKLGSMMRYEIKDNALSLYSINANAGWAFLNKKYPRNNFERDREPRGVWDFLRIKMLDDATLAALASIPNNEYYWHLETKFRRAPDGM